MSQRNVEPKKQQDCFPTELQNVLKPREQHEAAGNIITHHFAGALKDCVNWGRHRCGADGGLTSPNIVFYSLLTNEMNTYIDFTGK